MKWGMVFWAVIVLLGIQAIFFATPIENDTATPQQIAQTEGVKIQALRLSGGRQLAKLVFDFEGEGAKIEHVSALEPDRLIFTIKGATLGPNVRDEVGQADFAKIYAITAHTQGEVQVQVQLDRPALVSNILSLPSFQDLPSRLVVDIEASTKALFVARAQADTQKGQGDSDDKFIGNSEPEATEGEQPTAIIDDSRRLIVIDPGHGGADSGAVGPGGILEKRVVFEFAQELERQLAATGRYDVALTRTDDIFLSLEQRLTVARENKADLFISIHADSFTDANVQGASVYYLDENATDVLDKVLAENENRVDLLHGVATQPDTKVVDVLVDLMRRSTKRQSFQAAREIADGLKQTVNVRRFPARGGDFFVLKAPEVPSILLELGFMSNINDVQNFSSDLWRERAIVGIVRAVGRYFDLQDVSRVQLPATRTEAN